MRLAFVAAILLALPLVARAGQAGLIERTPRTCPVVRPSEMDQGELARLMQRFEADLSEPQRRAVQDAIGRRCALTEGGVTCANRAGLAAYRQLGVYKAFVAEVCKPATP